MHGKDIYPADRIIIIKITGFQIKSAGNHELFWSLRGYGWTQTSDLLRVKMRRGRKERVIPSIPPLLAQNDLLSAPLFPLFPAWSNSSLGQGLGQSGNQALFSRMTWLYRFKSGISLVMISQVVSGSTEP